MSRLRPCLKNSTHKAIPDDTALFLIRDSVERRKALIHGELRNKEGVCAIGAFFNDNPDGTLHSHLIDEVATVNDSYADLCPQQRWKKVSSWLRWKIRVMAGTSKAQWKG